MVDEKTITGEDIYEALKDVYDPEIPVNVVDLGLIYDCVVEERNVNVTMTLTFPGCGMGPAIAEDAKNKVLQVPGVFDVNIHLVWDPQWDRDMMTEEAKLQLGML